VPGDVAREEEYALLGMAMMSHNPPIQRLLLATSHPRGSITDKFDHGGNHDSRSRLMSGIILITVPTIQYGGYFLLTSLMNKGSGYMDNPLRQNFSRAGHV
jgi:hypothetical protein